MISSEYTNIKMVLNVKLIGQRAVKIRFIRIHPNILNYLKSDYFYSYDNKFTFYRKLNECKFSYAKFIIPTNPIDYSPLCSFIFKSDEERKQVLKRFSKALLEFSNSGHFHRVNRIYNNRKIKYLNNNWIIF